MVEGKTREIFDGSSNGHSFRRSSFNEFLSGIKRNPWMFSTVVVSILALILLVLVVSGSKGGVSGNAAAGNVISFAKAQGLDASFVSATEEGGFYNVVVKVNGQDVPVLVTLDGKYMVQQPIPLNMEFPSSSSSQSAEVPKNEKPVAEAFVFSYCPYGLQFEKALIPVYNVLKDKADIKIVFIGAMHGEYELVESLRQICVEKNYGRDKLFAYLDKFNSDTAVGACGGDEKCLVPLLAGIYSSLGIDRSKIDSCMGSDSRAIYEANVARASQLDIGGSPTFVVNGVKVQVGRTPADVLNGICSGFSDAPSECSQTLSGQAMTAGFGSAAGASTGASCNV